MEGVRSPTFRDAVALARSGLSARPPRSLEVPGFRRAAVLVPILDRPAGPTLLFTRRAAALPHHAGEISFPGGGLHPSEPPEAGALREAEEEVGLAPDLVELLGRLDDLYSIARFTVTPVVGAVASPPASFAAAQGEVEEAFELPLARLLDPQARRLTLWDPARLPPDVAAVVRDAPRPSEDVDPATGQLRVWSFHVDPARVVWGLSGRVLRELLERAYGG